MNKKLVRFSTTSKLLVLGVFLITIAAILTFLVDRTAFFTTLNLQQQPVNVIEVDASGGFVFDASDALAPHESGSFWGIFLGKKTSLNVLIKDDSGIQKNLFCKVNLQGSYSCLIGISDITIVCECYR